MCYRMAIWVVLKQSISLYISHYASQCTILMPLLQLLSSATMQAIGMNHTETFLHTKQRNTSTKPTVSRLH